jgi:hypothetical protein
LERAVGTEAWHAWKSFAAASDGPLEVHTRRQQQPLWQHPLSLPEHARESLDKMPRNSLAWDMDPEFETSRLSPKKNTKEPLVGGSGGGGERGVGAGGEWEVGGAEEDEEEDEEGEEDEDDEDDEEDERTWRKRSPSKRK